MDDKWTAWGDFCSVRGQTTQVQKIAVTQDQFYASWSDKNEDRPVVRGELYFYRKYMTLSQTRFINSLIIAQRCGGGEENLVSIENLRIWDPENSMYSSVNDDASVRSLVRYTLDINL